MKTGRRQRRQTVLQVASYGGAYPGNFIPSLRALGRELERCGLSQTIVFSHHVGGRFWLADLRDSGEDVRVLPASWVGALRGLGAMVSEIRPAIIHTHFIEFDTVAWLLQQVARAAGAAPEVLWHVHSPYSAGRRPFRRRVRELLKWQVLGRTTYAAVVSQGGYDAMLASGMRAERAICIPNGIEFARVALRAGERERARQALGVEDTEALCLGFGWHPEVKGVDLMFAGLRELGEAGRVKLVVVGASKLEDFAKRSFPSGVPGWIRVAPEVDDVSRYYAAGDVFLSASRTEGLPYAMVEAMAAGLPVVRSDIAGTAFAAELPATVTFRFEDPRDLARAVGEVLDWSPHDRATRVCAAAESVRARFGLGPWARSVVAWYQRILHGGAAQPDTGRDLWSGAVE